MDLNQYLNPTTIATIQAGGYIVMFGLMILEGPFVTLAAAFLASLGIFDIWIVVFLGWMGDIVGDFLFYSIGHYGLRIFSKKTAIDTPAEETFISQLDHLIHTNLGLALLLIKFTPYAPMIGLPYIGKIGVPLGRYLLYTITLCTIVPFGAAFIGYHIGYINGLLQEYPLDRIWPYLVGILCVLCIAVVGYTMVRRRSKTVFGDHPDLRPKRTHGKNTRTVSTNPKKKQ